ncbi:MAG: PGF-pre-PGF domain-containing protein [Candidatus Hadarchaeota archaeon]
MREGGSVTLGTPGKTLEIGGSSEGDVTVTENSSVSIGEVPAEAPVDVSVDASPLDGVNISVQNEITDLSIEISNLENEVETDIDPPENAVYNYQEIDVTATEDEIDEARLNANVEKSWLEEQGIDADSVRINRYHEGEWIELHTEVVDENATHIEIEAETPGFSTFAITGETDTGLPWILIGGILVIIVAAAVIVVVSRR